MKRRTLLALLPGVLASLGGCTIGDRDPGAPPMETTTGPRTSRSSPPGRRETMTPGMPTATTPRFDRTLDAVDDVGCDPTGETPCDAALDRAVTDGTVLRFPGGTYRFDRGHWFHDVERLGFVGAGDVTFVPPSGFNDKLIEITGDRALFKGIDLDVTAEDTTTGLRFITRSGFLVEDVEFVGRGSHPDESVVNALSLAVTDPSERGTVRNVVARHGSAIGHYKGGNGRVGIWIGQRHKGRIGVEDCRLEEFGNNGIYASRCFGTTAVVGGFYRNNNTSSVRLGGRSNEIRGVTIEVDTDEYAGPRTRTDTQYNTRGIVLEQGAYDKSGRVLVEDCDVLVRSADNAQGGIVVWPTGNGPRIERSRIATAVDWVPALRGLAPTKRVDAARRGVEIVDTTITGGAASGSAIELRERPGSRIERTTIEQTGADRDGVQLIASNPCTFASTSVTTTRFPVFVINPRTAAGTCLISLEGDTRFVRTGSDPGPTGPGGNESADPATPPTFELPDASERRCIGETILSELDVPHGIGITAVRDGTVSWTHRTAIETATGR